MSGEWLGCAAAVGELAPRLGWQSPSASAADTIETCKKTRTVSHLQCIHGSRTFRHPRRTTVGDIDLDGDEFANRHCCYGDQVATVPFCTESETGEKDAHAVIHPLRMR